MLRFVWLFAAILVTTSAFAQPEGSGSDLITSVIAVPSPEERAPGELARFQIDLDARPLWNGDFQAGDHLRLALPAGEQQFRITRVESFVPGTISVAGVAVDGSENVLSVTLGENASAGVVTVGGTLYHVQWSEGQSVLLEVDPQGVDALECAITEAEMPHGSRDLSAAAMEHATAAFNMTTLGDYGENRITIDVILAYTTRAKNWGTTNYGSIEAVIAQMMNNSHIALDNSEAHLNIRIVHQYETNYDETIPNMSGVSASGSHLRRFTAGPDFNPWGGEAAGFMEEVHDLRDQYGADLASLLAEVSGFGGVAWLLGNIAGSQRLGYSVNRVQQMATGYTFIHEIGHNMGSHHSRNQTSAAAPARGGIFPYSTGWRFDAPNDPSNNSYATVMTYAQSGSPRLPFFSNPEVLYQGVETGAYFGAFAPADNARSLRETKRIISAYRATSFEPPVASVMPTTIQTGIEEGQPGGTTLQLINSGESDLMWEVDLLVIPSAAANPGSDRGVTTTFDSEPAGLWFTADANHLSPSEALRGGGMIYETDFSSTDGFGIGTHHHENGWVSRTNDGPFWILSSNPNIGSQHMRVGVSSNSTGSVAVHSPFLGAWPTGSYEFSVDVSINQYNGPIHELSIRDGRTGETTAGVMFIGSGTISAFDGLTSSGSNIYTPTGHGWDEDVYHTLSFTIRPEDGEVDYHLDGALIATRPLVAGTSYGQLQINRGGGQSAFFMDLDNLSVKQHYAGFDWLTVDTSAGVTPPGETSDVALLFDGSVLTHGTYTATLLVRTNQADTPVIEVPLIASVWPVGDEGGPTGLADRLLGNFPNPARQSTTISYQLAEAGHVTMEVFSVTGRRVALLVDDYGSSGSHEVTFDTTGLASGVYLYRLRTENAQDTGRLVVVR